MPGWNVQLGSAASGGSVDDLLQTIKQSAQGMLPLEVYRTIFEVARSSNGGNIVEIGTALGAATITLALGAQASGKPFHVYSVDPFSGTFSSRTKFGSKQENLNYVRGQLEQYGVVANVSLVVGTSADLLREFSLKQISLLMLDADGRIDRDILILYDYLVSEAKLIIDDVDDGVFLGKTADNTYYVDLKHRTTNLLLKGMEKHGYLGVVDNVHSTAFCVRGERAMDTAQFSKMALDAYREIVFSTLSGQPWDKLFELNEKREVINSALRLYSALPTGALQVLRRIHRISKRITR
jgi:predicted O-methyltransferase YrrM